MTVKTKSRVLPTPSGRARSIVRGYSLGSVMEHRSRALDYQASRAQHITKLLAKPGVLVLNDPVGSGKTIVALTAAHLLLGSSSAKPDRVRRVVIVAPTAAVAEIWADRARLTGWNPQGHYRKPGLAATGGVHVLTRKQLGAKKAHWLDVPKRNVLLIVDEAHRGLQGNTPTYHNVARWAEGAHVLLVTATPFQLRPSGLERMLGIDGDKAAGSRVKAFTQATAHWLTARHDEAFPATGSDPAGLEDAVERAALEVKAKLAVARPDLTRLLMPPYDRHIMRMPGRFGLPPALAVETSDAWRSTYHVARLLPDLLQMSADESDIVARNSDAYMRMLTSSNRAWRDTTVYDNAMNSESESIRALAAGIDKALGTSELDHPKVAATAERAVAEALDGEGHVLIFSVFLKTQAALHDAITELLGDRKALKKVRVRAPGTAAQARVLVTRQGFGTPPTADNLPMIMIVRDNLSESIDLDGGRPVVIHHDLAWSPVRWVQRLGRVVRASTGFQPLGEDDVVVPVLDTAIDQRMWHTMQAREQLTTAVAPDVKSRVLLEEWLPDWGQDG